MGFAGSGCAYQDNVFFVVDKLQGFKLFKLRSELWVIFIFVKINKILLYRKPSFFDASCYAVSGSPFKFLGLKGPPRRQRNLVLDGVLGVWHPLHNL